MQEVGSGIWVLRYPLRLLGTEIGRTVTLVRLQSGQMVIHSTGPFTTEDANVVRALGNPKWIADATLFHDTFAREGVRAFPSANYLAPEGFKHLEAKPLLPAPAEWAGELEVLLLEGMPAVREHLLFHRRTRTLIVADLVFNFGPSATPWTRWFFRNAGGIREFPGVSRLFKSAIKDRQAFRRSADAMFKWDFDRVIVGHGDIIETGGKEKLRAALHGI